MSDEYARDIQRENDLSYVADTLDELAECARPYDSEWPDEFHGIAEAIRRDLRAAVGARHPSAE